MRSFTLLICFAFASLSISLGAYNEDDDDEAVFRVQGGYIPKKLETLGKYVVSIRSKHSENLLYGSGHFCGGTIITDKAILTAAHCTMGRDEFGNIYLIDPFQTVVVAGSPNRLAAGAYAETYEVAHINAHNDFDVHTLQNDIAILILEEKLKFNKFIAKCPLPIHEPLEHEQCTSVGWGRIFEDGPMASTMLYADLQVMNNQSCSAASMGFQSGGMLCAISKQFEEISPCQGDSGGPLFCGGYVTGIVSFGDGCGQKQKPDYFTKVFYYRNWILANSKAQSKRVIINNPISLLNFLIAKLCQIFYV